MVDTGKFQPKNCRGEVKSAMVSLHSVRWSDGTSKPTGAGVRQWGCIPVPPWLGSSSDLNREQTLGLSWRCGRKLSLTRPLESQALGGDLPPHRSLCPWALGDFPLSCTRVIPCHACGRHWELSLMAEQLGQKGWLHLWVCITWRLTEPTSIHFWKIIFFLSC